jgi:hypothetical protein
MDYPSMIMAVLGLYQSTMTPTADRPDGRQRRLSSEPEVEAVS